MRYRGKVYFFIIFLYTFDTFLSIKTKKNSDLLTKVSMIFTEFFKHEPPRSKVGYTVLFYLPFLFTLSVCFLFLPYFASVSPLWAVAGIKMFSACLYIYGSAEKYCIRSIMVCSVARIAAPLLVGGWDYSSLSWAALWYCTLEACGGICTLLTYITETLSPEMLEKLSERTSLGGLDETIIMPTYTRAAVCLMSMLEWMLGVRCLIKPTFIEWIVSKPEAVVDDFLYDAESSESSFLGAAVCFGAVTVITSSMLIVVVLVFKVAAMKWWIAAYHMNIAFAMLPLRLIFGVPFGMIFLICSFHFVAGLTITILPSALETFRPAIKQSINRAEKRIIQTVESIEKEVDKVTRRGDYKNMKKRQ